MSGEMIKLLVIDDHPFFGMDLKYKLHPYGIEVTTAPDAEKGMDQILFINKPHIVFIDYMMPEMDGIEAIKLIRKIKGFENIPLILFTSESYPDVIREAVKAGATDFIAKTASLEIILQKIQQHNPLTES